MTRSVTIPKTLTPPATMAAPAESVAPRSSQPSINTRLTTTAASVPVQTHAEHPSNPPAAAGPLQSASALATYGKPDVDHTSLAVRRNFDEHSWRSTRDHFSAVCQSEHDAKTLFDRLRGYNSYKITSEHHANFRQERKQAQRNGTDVSLGDAYAAISQPRKNDPVSLVNDPEGRSPLEELLPKDSPFRVLLDPATGSVRDVKSGLNADLVRREGPPKRYFLTFPGTAAVDTAGTQWKMNVLQFLGIGGVPKAYQDAARLAEEIRKNLPDGYKLELSGHSLGGGIASFVSPLLDIPAVGFNSAPLGPACMKALRNAGALTPERLSKLQQVRIEGDPVTSRRVSQWLSALANGGLLLRSRVPQLLGTIHVIRRGSDHYPQGSIAMRHRTDGFEAAYRRDAPKKAKIGPRAEATLA